METLIVMLAVFGSPVLIVGLSLHYKLKAKQLQAGLGQGADPKLLARCEELEQRIQTLETIVCEGDLDAAARMRTLSPRQAPALPAATPTPDKSST